MKVYPHFPLMIIIVLLNLVKQTLSKTHIKEWKK